MSAHIGHGRAFAAVGAFFTVAILVSGVLFLVTHDTGDPSAASSAGSAALRAELDTTLRQFPAICASVYSFDGNVSGFYEWLHMVAPNKVAPGAADARKVALKFATDILGLHDPTDTAMRWLSSTQSEVDVIARIPGDSAAGPLTIVSLRRDAKVWTVAGARTRIIQVTSPTASQPISSPLPVRGLSAVWEGVTTLRILETKGTKATELGRATVIGGGDTMHPFSGSVTFTNPGAPAGWAVFTSASGHNSETVAATALPVRFAAVAAPPRAIDLQLTPNLVAQDGWINLAGSDAVTFVLRADRTDRVRFFLNPVSNWNTPQVIPLGTAAHSGDVFTLTWHYQDEPLLARVSAVLSGPGGSTETMPFGLFHP